MKDALDAAAKKGFRLWSMCQGLDGKFRARLYNPVVGVEKPFTGTGIGDTPEEAVLACLTSDLTDDLWPAEWAHYRRPPKGLPDVLREAAAARADLTKAMQAGQGQ